MSQAEIITIGTELLLGEIQDTNTRTLAIALRGIGLDLYRTGTVGDNQQRIAQAVSEALERCEVVLTAGGLGPTVDDVTRDGIAEAVSRELEFRPDLWQQIEARFASFGRTPTENNRRQAMLPAGSTGISNSVGTAPAFVVELEQKCVIALPGVPAELEHLLNLEVLPYLRNRLQVPAVIKSRLLRSAGTSESWIDERIEDLERMTNPTVGLAAHPGRVDIRLTAKAGTEMEADELLWQVEATVRQRLGQRIYGTDDETLESALLDLVERRGMQLAVVESGTGGAISRGLAAVGSAMAGTKTLPDGATEAELLEALSGARAKFRADVLLAVALSGSSRSSELLALTRVGAAETRLERSLGGRLANVPAWAVSLSLEHLRIQLLNEPGQDVAQS